MTIKKLIIFVVAVALIILAIVGIVNGVRASREAQNGAIMGSSQQLNDYEDKR